MDSTLSLPERHPRSAETVFGQSIPPDITWSALRPLLDEMGEVVEEPYGILRITRKGQSLVLRAPAKGMGSTAGQLAKIRRFIARTEVAPHRTAPAGEWLVVIDRSEASVFRSLATGATPQLIRSHPSDHGMEPLPAEMTAPNGRGQAVPPGFFEPLAGVLHGAGRILIFGQPTALGNAADRFILWLSGYRPAIAKRIVASVPLKPDECSEAGFLAKARDYYQRVTGAFSENA